VLYPFHLDSRHEQNSWYGSITHLNVLRSEPRQCTCVPLFDAEMNVQAVRGWRQPLMARCMNALSAILLIILACRWFRLLQASHPAGRIVILFFHVPAVLGDLSQLFLSELCLMPVAPHDVPWRSVMCATVNIAFADTNSFSRSYQCCCTCIVTLQGGFFCKRESHGPTAQVPRHNGPVWDGCHAAATCRLLSKRPLCLDAEP